MIVLRLASFLVVSFTHTLLRDWFQILGDQTPATPSDAAQSQEAPTVDPEQERLMEEQQRRQEAVIQKDRVSFTVFCELSCSV